ncbi:FAD-dependent oxidoreductase [Propionibacteriaceae bacterium G1746]|uniref:FAD-dependent oxidoreductase n=1 Tax=Aestuariimicrobium sp. G57 TaxID=3418485 RepID=UPI003C23A05A
MSERIVVLGGGYVAITLTKGLARAIRRGQVEVTVVSRENYQVWHGFIGEMLTSRISAHTILNSARRMVAPARLVVAEVTGIDLAARTVTLEDDRGDQRILRYDQLVIGIGTADRQDAFDGLTEHAFMMKTFDDVFRLRNHLIACFERADHEPDPAERRRLLTFVVAGGGFAGCEIAGELTDYARLLGRIYPGVQPDDPRIVLVYPGEQVLPELTPRTLRQGQRSHPELVAYATRRLERLGVELIESERVAGVTDHAVQLRDGEVIPTATVISAIGSSPHPVLTQVEGLPRTESGRIQVDATCQVVGHPGVWAAGDCAAVPHPRGGLCPPVAIHALEQGRHVARNVLRRAHGQRPTPFAFTGFGQGASLGRRSAVAEIYGREITGTFAWVLWRTLLWRYVPTWDRKLRLVADWAIWPLVGRDAVEMSVSDADDFELHHMRFTDGEVIVDEGRARFVHVIIEGQAEQVAAGEVLHRFGAGDVVGLRWLDQAHTESVVARGVVRTIRLRTRQARELQTLVKALSQVATDRADTSLPLSDRQPDPVEGASV